MLDDASAAGVRVRFYGDPEDRDYEPAERLPYPDRALNAVIDRHCAQALAYVRIHPELGERVKYDSRGVTLDGVYLSNEERAA